jgi:hypothetical protein
VLVVPREKTYLPDKQDIKKSLVNGQNGEGTLRHSEASTSRPLPRNTRCLAFNKQGLLRDNRFVQPAITPGDRLRASTSPAVQHPFLLVATGGGVAVRSKSSPSGPQSWASIRRQQPPSFVLSSPVVSPLSGCRRVPFSLSEVSSYLSLSSGPSSSLAGELRPTSSLATTP